MTSLSKKKKPHQHLPSLGPDREALRQKGQFWTPDWVAQAMVSYVLRDRSATIFDPAVGAGAFFRAAKQLSQELGYSPKLLGYDIDPEVLQQAEQTGLSIKDLADVQIADFILNPPNKPLSAIVANPPYIRHHRIPNSTKTVLKSLSKSLLGKPLDGRAGLHVYFLLSALQCLAKNGRLAFIMPADTCEGVYASSLWEWIIQHYRLDAVITFSPEATPFPNVDTNPLVFLIRNASPHQTLYWINCKQAWTDDLKQWVMTDFTVSGNSLEIHHRLIKEASNTGLSRKPHTEEQTGTPLSSFAYVMRGIATGANDFFLLTRKRAEELNIPQDLLLPAIARTRDVPENEITVDLLDHLDQLGRPTLLFSPAGRPIQDFSSPVRQYLEKGIEQGLPTRALISQRNPWYKMETRKVPPYIFAYLGRRNSRFIRNTGGAFPLTGFLCVYPRNNAPDFISKLGEALNHPATIKNLALVGKSYGDGAIKVEPRRLENLQIPVKVLIEVGLAPEFEPETNQQLLLF